MITACADVKNIDQIDFRPKLSKLCTSVTRIRMKLGSFNEVNDYLSQL